jgi:hypothetical protein
VLAQKSAGRPILSEDVTERVEFFHREVAGVVQAGIIHVLGDDAAAEEVVVAWDLLAALDIRRKTMRRNYPLEGTITLIPILDIVSLVNANLRTGRLIIVNTDAKGEIYFEQGEIIHARCDGLTGKTAFYKLMDLCSGRFFFHNHLPNTRRTITDPLSLLLLSMNPHEERCAETGGDAGRREFVSTHPRK